MNKESRDQQPWRHEYLHENDDVLVQVVMPPPLGRLVFGHTITEDEKEDPVDPAPNVPKSGVIFTPNPVQKKCKDQHSGTDTSDEESQGGLALPHFIERIVFGPKTTQGSTVCAPEESSGGGPMPSLNGDLNIGNPIMDRPHQSGAYSLEGTRLFGAVELCNPAIGAPATSTGKFGSARMLEDYQHQQVVPEVSSIGNDPELAVPNVVIDDDNSRSPSLSLAQQVNELDRSVEFPGSSHSKIKKLAVSLVLILLVGTGLVLLGYLVAKGTSPQDKRQL